MLKKTSISTLLVLCFFLSSMAGNPVVSIIPKPVKMTMGTGNFAINDRTALFFTAGDEEAMNTASMFAHQLEMAGGPVLTALGVSKDHHNVNCIVFSIVKDSHIP